MSLKMSHLYNSLLPVGITLALLAVLLYSYKQDQIENQRIKNEANSKYLANHIDEQFYKLTRAAAEFVNRRETLEDIINFSQEGVLTTFIDSYVSGIELNVQISDKNNRVIFRSWDALKYGDLAPLDQQGEFQPKILELGGEKQFAVGLKALNSKKELLGYAIVASKLNKNFVDEIKHNQSDLIRIGLDNQILIQTGKVSENDIHARTYLKILPSLWVETILNENDLFAANLKTPHPVRNLLVLILCLLLLLNGYYIWRSTDKIIVEPILKIKSVIINGNENQEISELPKNEIGELGVALFNQKKEIESKTRELYKISEEYKNEAAMVKVLSHDLSNPLTVIKLSLDKLKKMEDFSDISKKHIIRISLQINMIEEILNHVKEMKALESGKKKLDLVELNFGETMNEIVTFLGEKLTNKEITLDWIQADEKTTFVAESISMRASVLSNLIQNAIKFSDRGSKIEIRCREINGMTRIDIRDYGHGIPHELREKLFSTSHQTNRQGTEGESGTGFGMSLVKFYVNLYGGTIEFTSKTKLESLTDYGTCFSIILKSKLTT